MKKVIKLLFAAIAVTGVMASCGGDGKNEGTGTLILSVEPDFMNNTSVIVNSGTDYAEFFTTYNGNPVTASLKMNGANFTGDDFSTTTAGTYKFKAEYDGATSNEVTVIAAEQDDLVLLSDKTTVKVGGKVHFIVICNGEDISHLCQVCDPDGMCLLPVQQGEQFYFLAEEAGEYSYKAQLVSDYNIISEYIDIIVLP